MGTFFSSNPISDIEFSSKGNMLIAERTMWANFVTQSGITVVGNGDYGSLSGSSSGMPWASDVNHHAAHNARVFEFTPNTSGGWNTSQYYVGASTIGVGSREGSAGGVDYGYDDYPLNCEQRIWMTGDYLKIIYNGQPRDIIYGLEATKTGMSANPNYETTDYYVDLNNMFGSQTADTFDKTTIGDVDVYRDPCSSSYIEVCKSTPPGTGLVGDFSFLATNGAKEGPFFRTDLLTVPVGYCTGPVPVPAGRLEVAEASTDGVIVNDIKVSGSRQNSVVSRDLRTGSVVLDIASVAPNAASTETIVDFVNTPTGQLKICKVAGPGVPLGTKFNFTVVSQLGTQKLTVPAGPGSQGGYCLLNGTFVAGTTVSITELPLSGYTLTGATVNINGTSGPPPTISSGGTTQVAIGAGFTTVTFNNASSVPCNPACATLPGGRGGAPLSSVEGHLRLVEYSFDSQVPAGGRLAYVTFRANLLSGGESADAMFATLQSRDPAVRVMNGQNTLNFVGSPSFGSEARGNIFTVLIDPAVPLDFSTLRWNFRSRKP